MSLIRRVSIAKVGEIPIGRTKLFHYGAIHCIAFNDQGTVKAYVNRCTHMGGPLELVKPKGVLRCRWHLAEFDPRTGGALEGEAPKGTALKPIELEVEDKEIFAVIKLPEDSFDVHP